MKALGEKFRANRIRLRVQFRLFILTKALQRLNIRVCHSIS